jgi:hypothetical protein
MAVSKLRHAVDVFFETTKKGYDATYWIFVIIAGASIVTKLFGIGGAAASIVAFGCFYFFGRISIAREKRRAEEEKELAAKKRQAKKKT